MLDWSLFVNFRILVSGSPIFFHPYNKVIQVKLGDDDSSLPSATRE